MRKDDRNVHVFQNRYWGPFTEEKRGYSFWKNGSFVYVARKKLVEAATSSYSATDDLLRYIYSVLVAKNHQNTQSRCLVHEFSFTDIFKFHFIWLWFLIAIIKRCAEQCALQLYRASLSSFILFSAAELNNIGSEDEI